MDKKATKKIASYTVNFEYFEEDGGGYLVTVPALRGCTTWGRTLSDAEHYAREVIQGFIQALRKQGKTVPLDRTRTRHRVTKKLTVRV